MLVTFSFTDGMMYYSIDDPGGKIIFTSDNMYMYK